MAKNSKKKRYIQDFELDKSKYDFKTTNPSFYIFYNDLFDNENTKNLSGESLKLYIYMKIWSIKNPLYDENEKEINKSDDFKGLLYPKRVIYSYSLAKNIINNTNTFKTCIKELKYYGFLMSDDEILKNGFTDNYKINKKGELVLDKDGNPLYKDFSDYIKPSGESKKNTSPNAKIYYFSDKWYKETPKKLSKSEISKLNK